jgi:hypothetical protein
MELLSYMIQLFKDYHLMNACVSFKWNNDEMPDKKNRLRTKNMGGSCIIWQLKTTLQRPIKGLYMSIPFPKCVPYIAPGARSTPYISGEERAENDGIRKPRARSSNRVRRAGVEQAAKEYYSSSNLPVQFSDMVGANNAVFDQIR